MQIAFAKTLSYDIPMIFKFGKGGLNLEKGMFVLERQFSELGKLQKAHRVRYCCESEGNECIFSLRDGLQEDRKRVSCPPAKAEMMLRYLFENAVSRENWLDILEDCMNAI